MKQIKDWFKNLFNPQVKNLPADCAYSISSIGCDGNRITVQNRLINKIVNQIFRCAEGGIFETIIHFPDWIDYNNREYIKSKLIEMGYNTLYADDRILLISWRR